MLQLGWLSRTLCWEKPKTQFIWHINILQERKLGKRYQWLAEVKVEKAWLWGGEGASLFVIMEEVCSDGGCGYTNLHIMKFDRNIYPKSAKLWNLNKICIWVNSIPPTSISLFWNVLWLNKVLSLLEAGGRELYLYIIVCILYEVLLCKFYIINILYINILYRV